MQKDLTTTLVKAWAFRLAKRLVSFSVYDVAQFTSLPAIEKIVELTHNDTSTTKLAKTVIKKLLDADKELGKLRLWLSLYMWTVMSRLTFLRTPYGAVRTVQQYVEDFYEMDEYARVKAVWRILLEALEEICSDEWVLSSYSGEIWMVVIACSPKLASFNNVNHRRRYDVFELMAEIKESEIYNFS
ncbi:hypothetical protein Cgig2_028180 [Carnegiea gigantea]|uniref:Uncharacterized protein n=1 Tax=Carnegiea gigantea TaxID=171969 RepID=A0A9Q1GUK6_9CARY|nr:hypothetical protein Cgig2_028180 [Carnegiea gigantea]